MAKLKPCPDDVKRAGAELVKLRLLGEQFAEQAAITRAAIKATIPGMVKAGAKEMEAGEALALISQAAMCEGLIGQAHNSLRNSLGRCGFAEPTNADLVPLMATITPKGGGGGGRGGRGR